jgi:branched-chain amino acid transport system ATP-binding protein
MLEISGVRKRFGGLVAVDGVEISVDDGAIVGLIGPNGAGKTTMVNLISGFVRPDEGTITLDGQRVDRLAPHRIAALGLRRTFQIESLFPELTVAENIRVGGIARRSVPVGDLVEFVGLTGRETQPAKLLPYGLRRRLAVAIALAGEPRMLLLDEPAAGMNANEAAELAALVRRTRERGVTVLVIEHNMDFISEVADSVVVMDFGKVIASGPTRQVLADPSVIEVYLGRWVEEAR